MAVVVVEAPALGEGWRAVSGAILEDGALATYDRQRTRELARLAHGPARRPSPPSSR